MAIEQYPVLNQEVQLTLTTGSVVDAWWDGAQWWVGLPNDEKDLPLEGSFAVSWALRG